MAIERDQTPRSAETPEPGFYRTRQVKGGPWLPAQIVCDNGMWLAFIGGEPTSKIAYAEPWRVPRLEWIAFSPRISEDEHAAMLQEMRSRDAGSPLSDPAEPIDWSRGEPLF